jgi:hypothetical protein
VEGVDVQPSECTELDVVDGIPDEYLEMNGSYEMTPEELVRQRDERQRA